MAIIISPGGPQQHLVVLSLALLISSAVFTDAFRNYEAFTDPISGRLGHVPLRRSSRRHLNAVTTCGAFVACPSADAAAKVYHLQECFLLIITIHALNVWAFVLRWHLHVFIAQMILGNYPNLTISNAVFTKGACSSALAQWGIVQNTSWAPGHVMTSWFPRGRAHIENLIILIWLWYEMIPYH